MCHRNTGGDVVLIAKSARGELDDGGSLARNFFYQEYRADYALATLEKPFIAFIDGFTMGGGVGVSVHGRFRVATERTVFAMPETAIGLFPDVGGSYFLPRLPGGLGLYLALSGARLKGEDVLAAGIATHFVSSSSIPLIEKEISKTTRVENILKEYDARDSNFVPSFAAYKEQIDTIFTKPTLKDVFATLDQDSSEWAKKLRATLSQMSPLSMMVTFEQLHRGKTMDLARCLEMEYTIAQHCVHGNDFAQGVRGKLMKGPEPVWKHSSIHEVLDEEVQEFFHPTDVILKL
eukprot:gene3678-8342_t